MNVIPWYKPSTKPLWMWSGNLDRLWELAFGLYNNSYAKHFISEQNITVHFLKIVSAVFWIEEAVVLWLATDHLPIDVNYMKKWQTRNHDKSFPIHYAQILNLGFTIKIREKRWSTTIFYSSMHTVQNNVNCTYMTANTVYWWLKPKQIVFVSSDDSCKYTNRMVNPHKSDLPISKFTNQMQITIYGQISEQLANWCNDQLALKLWMQMRPVFCFRRC